MIFVGHHTPPTIDSFTAFEWVKKQERSPYCYSTDLHRQEGQWYIDGLVKCILREFPNAGYKTGSCNQFCYLTRIWSAMQRVNPERSRCSTDKRISTVREGASVIWGTNRRYTRISSSACGKIYFGSPHWPVKCCSATCTERERLWDQVVNPMNSIERYNCVIRSFKLIPGYQNLGLVREIVVKFHLSMLEDDSSKLSLSCRINFLSAATICMICHPRHSVELSEDPDLIWNTNDRIEIRITPYGTTQCISTGENC